MANPQESEPVMRKVLPLRNYFGGMADPIVPKTKVYPKVTIPLDSLPEAKDWKIGESYTLELEVTMVGIRQDEYSNEATFELREIGVEDEEDDEA